MSRLSRCSAAVKSHGVTGTGKSTYINKHLVQGLPKDSWAPIFITFSARTTANMTQEQVCSSSILSNSTSVQSQRPCVHLCCMTHQWNQQQSGFCRHLMPKDMQLDIAAATSYHMQCG